MVVLRDQVVETAGLVEAVQEVTVQEAVDSADLVVVISEARDQAEVVEIETETGGAEVLTVAREIEMVVLIVAQVQIDQDIEVVNTILF
jgi:hypothetical protein